VRWVVSVILKKSECCGDDDACVCDVRVCDVLFLFYYYYCCRGGSVIVLYLEHLV
jgi:hypothetical protein